MNPENNITTLTLVNTCTSTTTVPNSVIEWVESRSKYPNGINSYRTHNGFPTLHGAAMANFLSVIQYLLDNGADVDVKDYRGRTAVEIVEKLGFSDISECLEWYKQSQAY